MKVLKNTEGNKKPYHNKHNNDKKDSHKKVLSKPKLNKYKEFLATPLDVLNNTGKDLSKFIKVASKIALQPSPISITSKKFEIFVQTLNTPLNRRIALVLPIIMFRLSALVIRNKDIFLKIFQVWDMTSKHQDVLEQINWDQKSFISKIMVFLHDYMKFIFKNSILGIAELILVTGIILEDIPRIFSNKDYIKLEDISSLELAKHLAKNSKDIAVIYETPAKKAEEKKRLEEAKEASESLSNRIRELRYELDVATTELSKQNNSTVKYPISKTDVNLFDKNNIGYKLYTLNKKSASKPVLGKSPSK